MYKVKKADLDLLNRLMELGSEFVYKNSNGEVFDRIVHIGERSIIFSNEDDDNFMRVHISDLPIDKIMIGKSSFMGYDVVRKCDNYYIALVEVDDVGFYKINENSTDLKDGDTITFLTDEEKSSLAKIYRSFKDEEWYKDALEPYLPKVVLKTGDPVLGFDGSCWRYDIFSHKKEKLWYCVGRIYKECIPYAGNENKIGGRR